MNDTAGDAPASHTQRPHLTAALSSITAVVLAVCVGAGAAVVGDDALDDGAGAVVVLLAGASPEARARALQWARYDSLLPAPPPD